MSATDSVKQRTIVTSGSRGSYSRAVKAFAAEQSTVVERRIVPSSATESAVAESDPTEVDRFARFRNKTAADGCTILQH